MPLTRAQLLSGNSSQGNVLSGQVQGITQGQGVSISPNGTISVNPLTTVGLMRMGQTKESARDAYNSYEWPSEPPTDTKQTISVYQLASGLTYLEWVDSNQITWTQKGQLAVGTGPGAFALLPAPTTAGQILSTDPATTEGLTYTANYVATTGSTGSALIPVGSTTEQPDPATTVGSIRYNSSIASLEYSTGTAWIPVASDPEVEDRIQFANATTPGLQVSVSAPVPNSNTGTTLSIGVDSATITEPGIVQLTNDYTGTSQTLGFTQYGASLLNAKINSITGGNILAGTYDSATGTVLTTTTAGAAAGFVIGSQAPAATTALDNYYLLVTVAGNQGPPGAPIPGTGVQSGDWFIVQDDGSGATWQTIDFENFAPTASQVSLAAVPGLTATNVQQGIQQLTTRTDATVTAVTSTTPGITVATTAATPFGNQAALTLNPPTATAIGGVKAGTNITIASDGTISATGGGGGGSVTSVTGTNGITVSPSTGSVVVNGAALLKLSGGTMTGPLVTAAGSSSSPALGIGSTSRGFYQASSGTAYTTGGGSAGTTLIISSNGQLLLGRGAAVASKTYGGGFIQMFGDGTSSGGAAAVFGQFGAGERATLTLMTGTGSVSSPAVLTSGVLGNILFSDPTSSTNLEPVPRAGIVAVKTGSGVQTDILVSVSTATSTSPTATWQFQGGAFRPYVDNNQVLGTTTYRPQFLCAVSGVINTSDPSKKKNVAPIEEGYGLDYVKSLNPVTFQWITEYNDVVPDPEYPNDPTKVIVTPVPGDVTHLGFLADEVSSSLSSGSLTEDKNGLVGKHKHLPPTVRQGADEDNLEEYWMNHSQLIPCLVKSVQQLSDALDTLQADYDAYKAAHP